MTTQHTKIQIASDKILEDLSLNHSYSIKSLVDFYYRLDTMLEEVSSDQTLADRIVDAQEHVIARLAKTQATSLEEICYKLSVWRNETPELGASEATLNESLALTAYLEFREILTDIGLKT